MLQQHFNPLHFSPFVSSYAIATGLWACISSTHGPMCHAPLPPDVLLIKSDGLYRVAACDILLDITGVLERIVALPLLLFLC